MIFAGNAADILAKSGTCSRLPKMGIRVCPDLRPQLVVYGGAPAAWVKMIAPPAGYCVS